MQAVIEHGFEVFLLELSEQGRRGGAYAYSNWVTKVRADTWSIRRFGHKGCWAEGMTKLRGKRAHLSSLRSALLSAHHKASQPSSASKGYSRGRKNASQPIERHGKKCRASTGEAAAAPRNESAGAWPPGMEQASQAGEQNAAGACDSHSSQTPRRPGL